MKYPDRVGALIHYGMYKLPEQTIKMANVGYKILDEFGATKMGCYFLGKLFGIKQEFENWETSPLLSSKVLEEFGYNLVIFPGSAIRVTVKALQKLFSILKIEGSTTGYLKEMVLFDELQKILSS